MNTAPAIDPALHAACDLIGLDSSSARPMREHGSAIYLLPDHDCVAKVNHRDDDRQRAKNAVVVTRWLIDCHDFPATEPVNIGQPVDLSEYGATVTFWRYYPQGERSVPPSAALGGLLAHLHQVGEPPVQLEEYEPLHSLGETVNNSSALSISDRSWLLDRRADLLAQYAELESPLGVGLIHGDAYPGNTLWGSDGRALLADWDEVATGPRELDLANTYQGGIRFGRDARELQGFAEAYGYNPADWNGFAILIEMRDLHTLASFIRLADRGNDAATQELNFRIGTLRSGDATARWNARR